MRIVILDGYTTNPGDLCWDKLKELGECTIYDRTAPGEVLNVLPVQKPSLPIR